MTKTCGKTHHVTTHRGVGFSRIHLGQIGGSSSNYSIWRSRPSQLSLKGNLNREVNPDAAKRRRRQRPIYDRPLMSINGRIKRVSRIPACPMSPMDLGAIVLPFKVSVCHVRRYEWEHVPSICVPGAPGTDPEPKPNMHLDHNTHILLQLNLMRCFVREFLSRNN